MTEQYMPEPLDEQTRELLAMWAKLAPKHRVVILRLMRTFT